MDERTKNGLGRDALLEEFLDSIEFKNSIRDYYSINVDEIPEGINLLREDVENSYGEQFKMSGFILILIVRNLKMENILFMYMHIVHISDGIM